MDVHALDHERFDVIRKVGEGAFGVVYEARDREHGGRVALKVLHSERGLSRFRREAALLSALDHPAIVKHVDHGVDRRGQAYLAMEWLEGHTLESRLERGALSIREVAQLGQRVAEAMEAMRRLGVVHRDLKPANLLLPAGDASRVMVVDFGLASLGADDTAQMLTQTGAILGTPAYMSPEQAQGEREVGFPSDVWSLGVVLHVCLTGRLPFEGTSPMATLMKVCLEAPQPVRSVRRDVPERVDELVQAMLHKAPEMRPSCVEIADGLSSLLDRTSTDPQVLSLQPANDVPSHSLRARGEQRVACALFVGPCVPSSDRTEAQLCQWFFDCGGQGRRLLDGTRVVVLDGALSPSDQAVAAAICAQQTRRLLPEAPMVLATGRAQLEEVAPLGELIDRGTALLRKASPGTVLLDDDSASLLSSRFSVHPKEEGAVLGDDRRPSLGPSNDTVVVSPFLGRERELTQLEHLFTECVEDNECKLVLVTAPAGTGKSRLRHEWRRRLHDHDIEVLVGRGDSVLQAVRFGLLRPALRHFAGIVGDDPVELQRHKLRTRMGEILASEPAQTTAEFLGEMLGLGFPDEGRPPLAAARHDPQLMADRVLSSWLTWVERMCAGRPLVLMLEDLHWADPASVRLLQATARVGERLPLMLAAFARPEIHESLPQLWADQEVIELPLGKLRPRHCKRLLCARLDKPPPEQDLERLVGLAEGNPFFVEELARAYAANPDALELPSSVLGTLQLRLDALGEDAKLVLRAASIFGQRFQADGVTALLHAHTGRVDIDRELRELEERDVVRRQLAEGLRAYAFRHGLIGDAAYRMLTDEDRALGHRLAAGWLERHPGTDPALLAEHYERGEAREQAAHYFCEASFHALQGGAMGEVVRLAHRSMDNGAEGSVKGEAAALLAEGLSWSGEHSDKAMEWGTVATTHLAPGSEGWWRAQGVLGISALRVGTPADPYAEAMVAQTARSAWTPESLMAVCFLAAEAYLRGQEAVAQRLVASLPPSVNGDLGGRTLGAFHYVQMGQAIFFGRRQQALEASSRAAEALRSAGSLQLLANGLMLLAYDCSDLGLHEDAERHFAEARALTRKTGSETIYHACSGGLGRLYRRTRRNDEAKPLLTEAREGFQRAGMPTFEADCLTELSRVELEEGCAEAAHELALRAVELSPGEPQVHARAQACLALVQARRGASDSAVEHAELAVRLLEEHELEEDVVAIRWTAADAVATAHQPARAKAIAAEAYRQLQRGAEAIDDPRLRDSYLEGIPEHRQLRQFVSVARTGR